jgi:hypothetical protein
MRNLIVRITAFLLFIVLLSGCKKDIDVLATAKEGSTPATGFGLSNIGVLAITVSASTTELDTAILVFNNAKYGADTKVTIVVDTSIVTAYNTSSGQSYDFMPSDVFTAPASITIPAGSLQGSGKLSVNIPKLLTYGSSFATGLSITAVSGGSGQIETFHSRIPIVIQVKNRYDGEYTVTGSMTDFANSALTGPYPWDVYLITSGPNQVQVFDNDYAKGIYHKIKNGSADSYYGSFGVVFNFDADGNVTSVVNLYGQPASNGRSATLDPSGINKYDAATGSLDVKYWMDQPSVITPHRTSFDEHYEFVGARP